MVVILLTAIGLASLAYAAILARAAIARRAAPSLEAAAMSAVINFFDALGIGSFAPTLAWLKLRRLAPDRLIPRTMMVGYAPPTLAEAAIFLALLGVKVDPPLLVGCVVALVAGAVAGAPVAARARTWVVQAVVAVALVLAAILYAMTNLKLMPGGGVAASLPPGPFVVAIGANFVFGALLNFGVGNYAPTLVLLSLMGMDPRLCFPIMAAGGAFALAGASARHIRDAEVDLRIAAGLAIGGVPAVLLAALVVKSLPLVALRWGVVVVVLYAAATMARAAMVGRRAPVDPVEERAEAL